MKSYTDIEQSKKLAEILPHESADMRIGNFVGESGKVDGTNIHYFARGESFGAPEIIDAWSLTALLNVIPKHIKDYNVLRIDISENDFAIWYDEIGYGVNNDLPNITMESAVDACVEMIIKLYELKLL